MSENLTINYMVDPKHADKIVELINNIEGIGDDDDVSYVPEKKGVKAGLRQGETRITCIFRDDQNQVIHDWARTTGRSFREVTIAMADYYIDNVVRRAAKDGKCLISREAELPEAYADLYDTNVSDTYAQYF